MEQQSEKKNSLLRAFGALALRLAVLLGIAWVLLSQVFLVTQARGTEMFPAVKDGDLVIAFRLQRSYAKNDVVVYSVQGKTKVGRVAAGPGDVVLLNESGVPQVNSIAQTGEILYPTYPKDGLSYPYGVPRDAVFLLGDYRTQAEDSRDFGAVPMENVEGKVITILRRRGV